jgi:hypothetical protein
VSKSRKTIATVSKPIPNWGAVAVAIAGPDFPTWLVPLLQWMAQSSSYERTLEDFQLNRSEMRSRLKRLHDAISLVDRSLTLAIDRPFLQNEQAGPIPSDLPEKLRDLAHRAGAAAISLSLSDGTTSRGRSRAFGTVGVAAKTMFAARFSELWAYFRGREPGPQENSAAEAIELYWKACGGDAAHGVYPKSTWRRHFESVRALPSRLSIRQVRAMSRVDIIQCEKRGKPAWFLAAPE